MQPTPEQVRWLQEQFEGGSEQEGGWSQQYQHMLRIPFPFSQPNVPMKQLVQVQADPLTSRQHTRYCLVQIFTFLSLTVWPTPPPPKHAAPAPLAELMPRWWGIGLGCYRACRIQFSLADNLNCLAQNFNLPNLSYKVGTRFWMKNVIFLAGIKISQFHLCQRIIIAVNSVQMY